MSTSEAVASTERRPKVANPAPSSPTGQRLDRQRMQRTSIPLMLPAAILLIVLVVGPIIYSFYLGFTNLKLVGPTARHHRFTGLDNINRLIGDKVFHQSLSLTAI